MTRKDERLISDLTERYLELMHCGARNLFVDEKYAYECRNKAAGIVEAVSVCFGNDGLRFMTDYIGEEVGPILSHISC